MIVVNIIFQKLWMLVIFPVYNPGLLSILQLENIEHTEGSLPVVLKHQDTYLVVHDNLKTLKNTVNVLYKT